MSTANQSFADLDVSIARSDLTGGGGGVDVSVNDPEVVIKAGVAKIVTHPASHVTVQAPELLLALGVDDPFMRPLSNLQYTEDGDMGAGRLPSRAATSLSLVRPRKAWDHARLSHNPSPADAQELCEAMAMERSSPFVMGGTVAGNTTQDSMENSSLFTAAKKAELKRAQIYIRRMQEIQVENERARRRRVKREVKDEAALRNIIDTQKANTRKRSAFLQRMESLTHASKRMQNRRRISLSTKWERNVFQPIQKGISARVKKALPKMREVRKKGYDAYLDASNQKSVFRDSFDEREYAPLRTVQTKRALEAPPPPKNSLHLARRVLEDPTKRGDHGSLAKRMEADISAQKRADQVHSELSKGAEDNIKVAVGRPRAQGHSSTHAPGSSRSALVAAGILPASALRGKNSPGPRSKRGLGSSRRGVTADQRATAASKARRALAWGEQSSRGGPDGVGDDSQRGRSDSIKTPGRSGSLLHTSHTSRSSSSIHTAMSRLHDENKSKVLMGRIKRSLSPAPSVSYSPSVESVSASFVAATRGAPVAPSPSVCALHPRVNLPPAGHNRAKISTMVRKAAGSPASDHHRDGGAMDARELRSPQMGANSNHLNGTGGVGVSPASPAVQFGRSAKGRAKMTQGSWGAPPTSPSRTTRGGLGAVPRIVVAENTPPPGASDAGGGSVSGLGGWGGDSPLSRGTGGGGWFDDGSDAGSFFEPPPFASSGLASSTGRGGGIGPPSALGIELFPTGEFAGSGGPKNPMEEEDSSEEKSPRTRVDAFEPSLGRAVVDAEGKRKERARAHKAKELAVLKHRAPSPALVLKGTDISAPAAARAASGRSTPSLPSHMSNSLTNSFPLHTYERGGRGAHGGRERGGGRFQGQREKDPRSRVAALTSSLAKDPPKSSTSHSLFAGMDDESSEGDAFVTGVDYMRLNEDSTTQPLDPFGDVFA